MVKPSEVLDPEVLSEARECAVQHVFDNLHPLLQSIHPLLQKVAEEQTNTPHCRELKAGLIAAIKQLPIGNKVVELVIQLITNAVTIRPLCEFLESPVCAPPPEISKAVENFLLTRVRTVEDVYGMDMTGEFSPCVLWLSIWDLINPNWDGAALPNKKGRQAVITFLPKLREGVAGLSSRWLGALGELMGEITAFNHKVEDVVRRILETACSHKNMLVELLLFGSRACGMAFPNADFDFKVLTKGTPMSPVCENDEIYTSLSEYEWPEGVELECLENVSEAIVPCSTGKLALRLPAEMCRECKDLVHRLNELLHEVGLDPVADCWEDTHMTADFDLTGANVLGEKNSQMLKATLDCVPDADYQAQLVGTFVYLKLMTAQHGVNDGRKSSEVVGFNSFCWRLMLLSVMIHAGAVPAVRSEIDNGRCENELIEGMVFNFGCPCEWNPCQEDVPGMMQTLVERLEQAVCPLSQLATREPQLFQCLHRDPVRAHEVFEYMQHVARDANCTDGTPDVFLPILDDIGAKISGRKVFVFDFDGVVSETILEIVDEYGTRIQPEKGWYNNRETLNIHLNRDVIECMAWLMSRGMQVLLWSGRSDKIQAVCTAKVTEAVAEVMGVSPATVCELLLSVFKKHNSMQPTSIWKATVLRYLRKYLEGTETHVFDDLPEHLGGIVYDNNPHTRCWTYTCDTREVQECTNATTHVVCVQDTLPLKVVQGVLTELQTVMGPMFKHVRFQIKRPQTSGIQIMELIKASSGEPCVIIVSGSMGDALMLSWLKRMLTPNDHLVSVTLASGAEDFKYQKKKEGDSVVQCQQYLEQHPDSTVKLWSIFEGLATSPDRADCAGLSHSGATLPDAVVHCQGVAERFRYIRKVLERAKKVQSRGNKSVTPQVKRDLRGGADCTNCAKWEVDQQMELVGDWDSLPHALALLQYGKISSLSVAEMERAIETVCSCQVHMDTEAMVSEVVGRVRALLPAETQQHVQAKSQRLRELCESIIQ